MKAIFVSTALFLLGSLAAKAQIGKTLEECTQHYGKPVNGPTPSGDCTFLVGHIMIAVMFHDGSADYLMFGKKGARGRGELPLSNTEIAALMNDNAAGRKWVLNAQSPTGGWVTDDGQILASRMNPGGGLIIETKEQMDRDAKKSSSPPTTPKSN
jgi:hypothetical protein